MDLERCRYVVVEGPIGAGKTSLARVLAQHAGGEELFERPEDNPFLERFYGDMPRFALATQLTFLFQRVDQLAGVGQFDMFRKLTVADFLLDKDPLFARLNLTDAEYGLYEKVYSHLKPQTPTPDLVIYLQAPVETLIERVHRRGVNFERRISAPYLSRLADAYSRYFYAYEAAPLLIVNSERLNFVDDEEHVRLLLAASRRCAGAANSSIWHRDGSSPGFVRIRAFTSPSARAIDRSRAGADGTRRSQDRDADRLRRDARRGRRSCRCRRAVGRRFARHGRPGPRGHASGKPRRRAVPHAMRGGRAHERARHRRPSVRNVCRERRGSVRGVGRGTEGRRQHGEGRGRFVAPADGRVPDGRHGARRRRCVDARRRMRTDRTWRSADAAR
jgi:deoxyadenosine/deoxycytidine kinase